VVRVSGYKFRGIDFDSRRYQIFLEVVGQKRFSPSPCDEKCGAAGKKISGSALEN
jgi:hypothetical protein